MTGHTELVGAKTIAVDRTSVLFGASNITRNPERTQDTGCVRRASRGAKWIALGGHAISIDTVRTDTAATASARVNGTTSIGACLIQAHSRRAIQWYGMTVSAKGIDGAHIVAIASQAENASRCAGADKHIARCDVRWTGTNLGTGTRTRRAAPSGWHGTIGDGSKAKKVLDNRPNSTNDVFNCHENRP